MKLYEAITEFDKSSDQQHTVDDSGSLNEPDHGYSRNSLLTASASTEQIARTVCQTTLNSETALAPQKKQGFPAIGLGDEEL